MNAMNADVPIKQSKCKPCPTPGCGLQMLRRSPHATCRQCRERAAKRAQGVRGKAPRLDEPLRATKLEELASRAAAGLPLFQREGEG